MLSSPRRLVGLLLLTTLFLLALGAAPALAKSRDGDGDGLPDKWEKRYGLSTRKNDANRDKDRDKLTNLSEYQASTNPRRADSDGDGLRDANEDADDDGVDNYDEQRAGTHPAREDSDGDGVPDRQDGRQVEGKLTAVGENSVTITRGRSRTTTLSVDSQTRLRVADRNKDGTITIADLRVGDQVEAHADASGARAADIEVKGIERETDELAGVLSAIGEGTLTITTRRGQTQTVRVDAATRFRGPDRNQDKAITVADLLVGDKVELRLTEGLALLVKAEPGEYQGDGQDQGDDGQDDGEGDNPDEQPGD